MADKEKAKLLRVVDQRTEAETLNGSCVIPVASLFTELQGDIHGRMDGSMDGWKNTL